MYLENPKSSADLDKELSISLSKFDTLKSIFIDQLEMGQLFCIKRKDVFKKISKKRKRYVCEKISNGKLYLFQPNSLILDYKNEKDNNFFMLLFWLGVRVHVSGLQAGNLFRNNLLI